MPLDIGDLVLLILAATRHADPHTRWLCELGVTIVNVALGRHFGVPATSVDICNLVSLAVFIPASGWLGDRSVASGCCWRRSSRVGGAGRCPSDPAAGQAVGPLPSQPRRRNT
jgi:hypothetical protein